MRVRAFYLVLHIIQFAHEYVLCNTVTMDSSSEAADAVKMDNDDNEASGGRASKCSIRKCLCRNGRRGSQTTNASCKYTVTVTVYA